MNILTITANDDGLGGASRIAVEAHRAYAAAGHDVSMFTGKKTSSAPDALQLRRPVPRCSGVQMLQTAPPGAALFTRPFWRPDRRCS